MRGLLWVCLTLLWQKSVLGWDESSPRCQVCVENDTFIGDNSEHDVYFDIPGLRSESGDSEFFLSVNVEHSNLGDLRMNLNQDGSDNVLVWKYKCDNSNDLNAVFVDDEEETVWGSDQCERNSSEVVYARPQNSFQSEDIGDNPQGTYRFRLRDDSNDHSGYLTKVCIGFFDRVGCELIGAPTTDPTANPSEFPSVDPTGMPTVTPTLFPTFGPSLDTFAPTTSSPTIPIPTQSPSPSPSDGPTGNPTRSPSSDPSRAPTLRTMMPTEHPTTPNRDNSGLPSFYEYYTEPVCESKWMSRSSYSVVLGGRLGVREGNEMWCDKCRLVTTLELTTLDGGGPLMNDGDVMMAVNKGSLDRFTDVRCINDDYECSSSSDSAYKWYFLDDEQSNPRCRGSGLECIMDEGTNDGWSMAYSSDYDNNDNDERDSDQGLQSLIISEEGSMISEDDSYFEAVFSYHGRSAQDIRVRVCFALVNISQSLVNEREDCTENSNNNKSNSNKSEQNTTIILVSVLVPISICLLIGLAYVGYIQFVIRNSVISFDENPVMDNNTKEEVPELSIDQSLSLLDE